MNTVHVFCCILPFPQIFVKFYRHFILWNAIPICAHFKEMSIFLIYLQIVGCLKGVGLNIVINLLIIYVFCILLCKYWYQGHQGEQLRLMCVPCIIKALILSFILFRPYTCFLMHDVYKTMLKTIWTMLKINFWI